MNLRITYMSLGVSDLGETERFYRDILGLAIERTGGDLCIRWPDLVLVFTENPPSARGKFHFGFRVGTPQEVDAWADKLRQKNARVLGAPTSEDGERKFYFLDPDQYEIVIYSDS